MRSTLFYLPHQIGSWPLFGWGFALILLVIAFVLINALAWNNRGNSSAARFPAAGLGGLAPWLLMAGMIVFVLPNFESQLEFADEPPIKLGIPIRGYGVMLMLGVIAATYLSYRRARPHGINLDTLISLALWGMIGGIGGARLFYVIQKWSEFEATTLQGRLIEALRFTEGGLVVYGGVIGGLAATGIWCYRRGRSFLQLADIVTPGFLVGLALGRIGCLLNGCCYGGVCEQPLPAITFPAGSPAYLDQLYDGSLLGVEFERSAGSSRNYVESITPGGWAAIHGIEKGNSLSLSTDPNLLDYAGPPKFLGFADIHDYSGQALPDRSLPVHPSQIYATINAAILAGLLASLPFAYRTRGQIFALGLMLYGVSRCIEEFIRVDEAGQFGTIFSIGQWVSLLGIIIGLAIWIATKFRPAAKSLSFSGKIN